MKHLPALLGLAAALLTPALAQEPTILFKQGDADYGIYRAPGLVRTSTGNLIAYAEGRKNAEMRWSETRPFFRVSTDGGKTWSDAKPFAQPPADAKQNAVLVEKGAAEAGQIGVHNLSGTADKDGNVHWLYAVEFSRLFYVKTNDKGEPAGDAVEITKTFDEFKSEVEWKLAAPSPGHGIQLASGRLVVPVWVSDGNEGIGLQAAAVSTVFSDDGGKTWKRGEIAAKHFTLENTKTGTPVELPSESAIAQAKDGTVVLNIRNKALKGQRAQASSPDGATGWSEAVFVEGLMEPICQGSLTAAGDAGLIFANPANMIMRKSLTARLSSDSGKTWPKSHVIDEGVSGYSDLASDGKTVFVVYERGAAPSDRDPEAIAFTSFGVDALK
ncbi:MAG: exo-alpha-sialidase [Verrucomicrobiales bacterium]|nr:exo-alpha-sialidase [Verrucomicrobiales bacterium]